MCALEHAKISNELKTMSRDISKGQLKSEWIFEVIVFPKMPTKYYIDFCPGRLLEGMAEISVIFS